MILNFSYKEIRITVLIKNSLTLGKGVLHWTGVSWTQCGKWWRGLAFRHISLGALHAKNVIPQKFNIMKRMFHEINFNRNLTFIVVELGRHLLCLCAEMQWITDTLSACLSRRPTTTEVPPSPISRPMVQERTCMSTSQPSLVDRRLESKLVPWPDQIHDDCYVHGSLYSFFSLLSVYPGHQLTEYFILFYFFNSNITLFNSPIKHWKTDDQCYIYI